MSWRELNDELRTGKDRKSILQLYKAERVSDFAGLTAFILCLQRAFHNS
jgi:hypothetical protein